MHMLQPGPSLVQPLAVAHPGGHSIPPAQGSGPPRHEAWHEHDSLQSKPEEHESLPAQLRLHAFGPQSRPAPQVRAPLHETTHSLCPHCTPLGHESAPLQSTSQACELLQSMTPEQVLLP